MFLTKYLSAILLAFTVASASASASASTPAPTNLKANNVGPICEVRAYGAKGDSTTLDTRAINAAISDCSARSGNEQATVHLSPGIYRSGTIYFQDNVDLDLASGATILASDNLVDYPPLARASEWRNTALLVAENRNNIAITGQGTIDGNGRAFIAKVQGGWRPSFDATKTRQGQAWADRMSLLNEGPLSMALRPGVLFVALHVQGLRIENIHIVDSPNWTVKIGCSQHIRVRNIDVRNNLLIPNNDALDISTSNDAIIDGGYLQAGDDAIVIGGPCLDGWCQEPTFNVTIKNLTLVSRSAAIRVGPAARGVHDVHFSQITVRDSNRGILLHTRTNETVENISFDHIDIATRLIDGPWWGAGEPISIGVALSDYISWPKVTTLGFVRHIRFSHIRTASGSPIVLYSMEPGHISDVRFRDVAVEMRADRLATALGGNLDLQPTTPLNFGVQKWQIPAIYVHNVDQLSFDYLRLRWRGKFPDFYTNAIEADGFNDLSLQHFQGTGSPGDGRQPQAPTFSFKNGNNLHRR
jgi:polygalacturonase